MISCKTKIQQFLSDRLLVDFDRDVDADSDLFQLGLMDSETYAELIQFIEKTFHLQFSDEEILSNVVASLSGIVSFVSEALEHRAAGSFVRA